MYRLVIRLSLYLLWLRVEGLNKSWPLAYPKEFKGMSNETVWQLESKTVRLLCYLI